MKTTKTITGILAFALVFMFAGCPNPSGTGGTGTDDGEELTGSFHHTGITTPHRVTQRLAVFTESLNGTGTVTIQWFRNGVLIPEASGPETAISDYPPHSKGSVYTLVPADEGTIISVRATREGYSGNKTVISPYPVLPSSAPMLTGSVSITGTLLVGQTLTANTSGLSGGTGQFLYQWSRETSTNSFTSIPGATASTYLLTSADLGRRVMVRVIREGTAGTSTNATTGPISGGDLEIGKLTITNFGGASGLTANRYIWGGADNGDTMLYFVTNADAVITQETIPQMAKVTGTSITLNVYKVVGETLVPFTGNATIPVYSEVGGVWLSEKLTATFEAEDGTCSFFNKAAITFINGNATINFNSQIQFSFDGIWTKDDFTIGIEGTDRLIKLSGINYEKGTISYTGSTITSTKTHIWEGGTWVYEPDAPVTFSYVLNNSNNTMTLSGGEGGDAAFNGVWIHSMGD